MDLKQFYQQTLVLIKPDALERGLTGEIISRFERVGLRIVQIKSVIPDKALVESHYPITDEWSENVGKRTLADFEKNGLNVKENLGTDNPIEIGRLVHQWNVEQFTGAEIIALVIEGVNAIEAVRKICGPTLPLLAQSGTIRGDYSTTSAVIENSLKKPIRNLVHASGDPDEAKREIKLWFPEWKKD